MFSSILQHFLIPDPWFTHKIMGSNNTNSPFVLFCDDEDEELLLLSSFWSGKAVWTPKGIPIPTGVSFVVKLVDDLRNNCLNHPLWPTREENDLALAARRGSAMSKGASRFDPSKSFEQECDKERSPQLLRVPAPKPCQCTCILSEDPTKPTLWSVERPRQYCHRPVCHPPPIFAPLSLEYLPMPLAAPPRQLTFPSSNRRTALDAKERKHARRRESEQEVARQGTPIFGHPAPSIVVCWDYPRHPTFPADN